MHVTKKLLNASAKLERIAFWELKSTCLCSIMIFMNEQTFTNNAIYLKGYVLRVGIVFLVIVIFYRPCPGRSREMTLKGLKTCFYVSHGFSQSQFVVLFFLFHVIMGYKVYLRNITKYYNKLHDQ